MIAGFFLAGRHIADLGVRKLHQGVFLKGIKPIPVAVPVELQKTVVILAGHHHVYVVIPRNKALVAYRAK